jgi:hypothetical protein
MASKMAAARVAHCSCSQISRDDLVDDAEHARLGHIDRTRGKDQVERLLGADEPRHSLRPARSRDDPQRDLRHAEAACRRRHPVVTGQRDLEASAQHSTVHCCDHRNRQVFVGVEQRPVFRFLGRAAELSDVCTGKEGIPLAQQHHGCDARHREDLLERRLQSRTHLGGDRVERRTVGYDQRHLAVALDADRGRRLHFPPLPACRNAAIGPRPDPFG